MIGLFHELPLRIRFFAENFTFLDHNSKSRVLLQGFLDGFGFLVKNYIGYVFFVEIPEDTFLLSAFEVALGRHALSLLHTLSPTSLPLSRTGAACISYWAILSAFLAG